MVRKAVLVLTFLLLSAPAFADITCEPGQTNTSFGDGNNVSEVCVDSSEMAPPDAPVFVEGEEDPTNYD